MNKSKYNEHCTTYTSHYNLASLSRLVPYELGYSLCFKTTYCLVLLLAFIMQLSEFGTIMVATAADPKANTKRSID